jgi:hypothetical protein
VIDRWPSFGAGCWHNHKEQNDVFQNTLYSKGNQTLAVFRMADPSDKSSVVVIASLSTR